MTENKIKEKFVELVKSAGTYSNWTKSWCLETFEYCSDHGCELAGSTIDKIEVYDSNSVAFFYNENTNDWDELEHFKAKYLTDFYKSLTKAMAKDYSEYVKGEMDNLLCRIMVSAYDRQEFIEATFDKVLADMNETAKPFGGNDSDVAICFSRVLLGLAGVSI